MSEGTSLVTVVVPVYNGQEYIEDALNSLARQTYRPIEVIVVDDGSTDSTVQKIQNFAASLRNEPAFKRERIWIKVVTQRNRGPSAARNRGIDEARGYYVAFLDADDQWEPEKIARQIELIELHPGLDIVLTNAWILRRDEHRTNTFTLFENENLGLGFFGHEYIVQEPFKKLLQINFIPTSSLLAKKTCFGDSCRFTETRRHAEDWELWLKLAKRYSFGYIAQPGMTKREEGAGLSANQDMMIASRMEVLRSILAGCEDKFPEGIESAWVKTHLRNSCKWTGYHFFKKKKDRTAITYFLLSLKNGLDMRVLGYLIVAGARMMVPRSIQPKGLREVFNKDSH